MWTEQHAQQAAVARSTERRRQHPAAEQAPSSLDEPLGTPGATPGQRQVVLLSDDDDSGSDDASFVESSPALPQWAIQLPAQASPPVSYDQIAPTLSDPQGSFVTRIFDLVDVNRNGSISRAELLSSVRANHAVRDLLGLPGRIGVAQTRQLDEVFYAMDKDGSRGVSLDEFCSFMYSRFGLQDTKTRFVAMMSAAGEHDAAAMIQATHRRRRTRVEMQGWQQQQRVSHHQPEPFSESPTAPAPARAEQLVTGAGDWQQQQQQQEPYSRSPQALQQQPVFNKSPQGPPPQRPLYDDDGEQQPDQQHQQPQFEPEGPSAEEVRTQLLELVRRQSYEFRLDPSVPDQYVDDHVLMIHDGGALPVVGLSGVYAGSLRKLVELLTSDPHRIDAAGSEVLLRSNKADPERMLDLLMRRYLIPAVTARAESTDQARCDAIRSATLVLLREWIQVTVAEMSRSVLLNLWVFIEDHVSEQDRLAANELRVMLSEEQLYEGAAAADAVLVLRPHNPGPQPPCLALLPPHADASTRLPELSAFATAKPPALPQHYTDDLAAGLTHLNDLTRQAGEADAVEGFDMFLDLDFKELAKQVTLVAYTLFCEIPRAEFLRNDWTRAGSPGGAAGGGAAGGGGGGGQLGWVVRERTPVFRRWVSTCVVRSEDPVGAVLKWIDVARHCLELQNLTSLVDIVRGLEHGSVAEAWRHLQAIAGEEKPEAAAEADEAQGYLHMFSDLHAKCAPDENYALIRQELRRRAFHIHAITICSPSRLGRACTVD